MNYYCLCLPFCVLFNILTKVGFPYHLNKHKKKILGQIVDITNNLLLDDLLTVDYYSLIVC